MGAGDKQPQTTRLSRIHPYPAMIADDLAIRIAVKHVWPGSSVLDPFCGTARTLYAAARVGGECFGIDVNPLAVLIAQAKGVRKLPAMPEIDVRANRHDSSSMFHLQPGRKVKWFSEPVERELNALIRWINSLRVEKRTVVALACILSATVRDVSFCRKRQWKLHRMPGEARSAFRPSALKVFRHRLNAVSEALDKQPWSYGVTVGRGDAKVLSAALSTLKMPMSYDVVFTSPPYGDSRSTVGYGGISSICLGVLRHLRHLGLSFQTGQEIDNSCLGGLRTHEFTQKDTAKYWKGDLATSEGAKVSAFLEDLTLSCQQIAAVSHIGTKAILVVSRRCVRRRRVYIDHFLLDRLKQHGFALVERSLRRIDCKNTPRVINRKARGKVKDRTRTMEHEFLLVFEKAR